MKPGRGEPAPCNRPTQPRASARKKKGTLRRHVLSWTGRVRDSVYFSILDSEWPQVKPKLERLLRRKES